MSKFTDAIFRIGVGVVVRRVALSLSLSAVGLSSISTEEGTVNHVYKDAVGISTVCTGHATNLRVGTQVSDAVCAELLKGDSQTAVIAVRSYVTTPISQNQFDALVSFVFNVGSGAFERSTLLKELNAGQCHAAALQFLVWDKAGGRVIAGLHDRRERESAKFEKDCP